jgi:hypothetical protein
VAKLEARPIAAAALGSNTELSKNHQWTTSERNSQNTLAREKYTNKIYFVRRNQLYEHFFWAAVDPVYIVLNSHSPHSQTPTVQYKQKI